MPAIAPRPNTAKSTPNPRDLLHKNRATDPRLRKASRFVSKAHFPGNGGVNAAGYQLWITPFAQDALASITDLHARRRVTDRIAQLSALPRSLDTDHHRSAVELYRAPSDRYLVHYGINSGRITVFDISLNKALQAQADRQEEPQLYRIRKNESGWTTRTAKPTDRVQTTYAAVNGMQNNLKKAVWLMAEHLEHYHGETFNEFTLYHNPTRGIGPDFWESMRDKFGLRSDVTRLFVDVLGDTQHNDREVHWLAHSQGGIIFSEAVRDYVERGIYRGRLLPHSQRRLDKQRVIFAGTPIHIEKTKLIMEKAGIESDHRSDPRDPVHQVFGLNALKPFRPITAIKSFAAFPDTLGGTPESSPHTMAYKGPIVRKQLDRHGAKNPNLIKAGINWFWVRFYDF